MVLESIINPKRVLGKPWEMVLIGFVYAIVATFLALWIFKSYVSIVAITLTVIASVPFMYNAIRAEEKKEGKSKEEGKLLKEHKKVISSFLFLFLGFVAAYTCLYLFMPAEITEKIFTAQLETIIAIKPNATGNFNALLQPLISIFLNNIKILVFCITFSFFYGAGAIFILAWNASVMSTAIGFFIRTNLFHAKNIFDYFQITTVGILRYFIHGIPEIIGYLIGALAGGMISAALVNHDFMDEKFKKIAKDIAGLLVIAVAIIAVAALIEIYISPILAS